MTITPRLLPFEANEQGITNKATLKAASLLAFHDDELCDKDRAAFQTLIANNIDSLPGSVKAEIAELFSTKPVEKTIDPLQAHLISSDDPVLYEPILRDSPYLHASHILSVLLSSKESKRAILATRPDLDHATTAALIRLGGRIPLDNLIQNPDIVWSNGLLALLMGSESTLVDPLYRLIAGPATIGVDQLAYAYWEGSKAVKLAIIERLGKEATNKNLALPPMDYVLPNQSFLTDQLQHLGKKGDMIVLAEYICSWLNLPNGLAERLVRDQDGLNLMIALKVLRVSDDITLLTLGCLWVKRADLEVKLEQALNYSRLFSDKVARMLVDLWRKHELRMMNSLRSEYNTLKGNNQLNTPAFRAKPPFNDGNVPAIIPKHKTAS